MTTLTVAATKAAVINAITTCAAGDVIKVGEGAVAPFYWPANTNKAFTLTGQRTEPDRQPVFRGVCITGGSPGGQFHAADGDPKFSTCTGGVVFDGLHFDAAKLTTVKQSNNGPSIAIDDTDSFGGFGWRIDFTTPNCANLGENSRMQALVLGDTVDNFTVRNCQFEGFGTCIKPNCNNLLFEWNSLIRNCEDMIQMFGLNDALFQYNSCTDFRGVSYADAHKCWGWQANGPATGGVPPHADFFQFAADSSSQLSHRVKILHNYLEDDTCRVHGFLMNNNYGRDKPFDSAKFHVDLTANFNELRMTHTTGINQQAGKNIQIRGNKIYRLKTFASGSPENPDGQKNDTKLGYGQQESAAGFAAALIAGTCDVSNNVVRKIQPTDGNSAIPNSWTVDNPDSDVNSDTIFPDNWQHIRKSKVLPGDPWVGIYGQGGTPPVTSGDAMQDEDFNMLGAMPDPAFPSPDTKMTGCIEIPPTSIAFAMPTIWWGDSDDTPLPTVYLGTTTGGSKLYRLQTAAPKAADYHMRAPTLYFGGIYVYYKDTDGVMSQKSALTCRFTTPATADRTVVYVKPRT